MRLNKKTFYIKYYKKQYNKERQKRLILHFDQSEKGAAKLGNLCNQNFATAITDAARNLVLQKKIKMVS